MYVLDPSVRAFITWKFVSLIAPLHLFTRGYWMYGMDSFTKHLTECMVFAEFLCILPRVIYTCVCLHTLVYQQGNTQLCNCNVITYVILINVDIFCLQALYWLCIGMKWEVK